MITNSDGHLAVPIDYDLIDTLDLLCEVLRYASDELPEDIVDRYRPGTYQYLIDTVDAHASVLRRATSPGQPRAVTR